MGQIAQMVKRGMPNIYVKKGPFEVRVLLSYGVERMLFFLPFSLTELTFWNLVGFYQVVNQWMLLMECTIYRDCLDQPFLWLSFSPLS